MDVRFLDTTLRDGSQSLWASGMRFGMMEAVAGHLARDGFVEVEAMRAAGAPRRYSGTSLPMLALVRELGKQKTVRYVHVRRSGESLALEQRAL